MEKSRKNLRAMSLLVLTFALISLIRMVITLAFGGYAAEDVGGDVSQTIINVVTVIIVAIGFAILLPQIYVGYKGLKVSGGAKATKGYITWAKVLLVLSVIASVSIIVSLFEAKNIAENVSSLIDIVIDVFVYYFFIKYAKEVSAGR